MIDLIELADNEPEGLETLRVWKVAIEPLEKDARFAGEASLLTWLFDALDAEERVREELSEPKPSSCGLYYQGR